MATKKEKKPELVRRVTSKDVLEILTRLEDISKRLSTLERGHGNLIENQKILERRVNGLEERLLRAEFGGIRY